MAERVAKAAAASAAGRAVEVTATAVAAAGGAASATTRSRSAVQATAIAAEKASCTARAASKAVDIALGAVAAADGSAAAAATAVQVAADALALAAGCSTTAAAEGGNGVGAGGGGSAGQEGKRKRGAEEVEIGEAGSKRKRGVGVGVGAGAGAGARAPVLVFDRKMARKYKARSDLGGGYVVGCGPDYWEDVDEWRDYFEQENVPWGKVEHPSWAWYKTEEDCVGTTHHPLEVKNMGTEIVRVIDTVVLNGRHYYKCWAKNGEGECAHLCDYVEGGYPAVPLKIVGNFGLMPADNVAVLQPFMLPQVVYNSNPEGNANLAFKSRPTYANAEGSITL